MKLHPAKLEEIVGSKDIARRLMREAGGRRIPELTERRVSRETLYHDIRVELSKGYTYAEAAERFDVSRYTVWKAVLAPLGK